MKDKFDEIRALALPYQDQRDDEGHAAVTQEYAAKLVELEKGDEEVVLPAIILHDIGYSQLPKEKRLLVFDRKVPREERLRVQLDHQREGVRLAGEILKRVGYPEELTAEILEIISQHDTRKGFISRNEGLVRDADKLWRFSSTGFNLGNVRNLSPAAERIKRLEKDLERADYIYSASARQMARQELEDRKRENLAD